AACQGIRRVLSGGIGECRTSKLNSRNLDTYIGDGHPYLLRNVIHKNCLDDCLLLHKTQS
ncbi:hypothetical protein Q7I19_20735, partial [Aeromonas veronii]|uniref:hypothetical protein n=1 Tax=Aeromonas veronii TaxID=654 RepID=UPI00300687B4